MAVKYRDPGKSFVGAHQQFRHEVDRQMYDCSLDAPTWNVAHHHAIVHIRVVEGA
jgi:hypothetical protein